MCAGLVSLLVSVVSSPLLSPRWSIPGGRSLADRLPSTPSPATTRREGQHKHGHAGWQPSLHTTLFTLCTKRRVSLVPSSISRHGGLRNSVQKVLASKLTHTPTKGAMGLPNPWHSGKFHWRDEMSGRLGFAGKSSAVILQVRSWSVCVHVETPSLPRGYVRKALARYNFYKLVLVLRGPSASALPTIVQQHVDDLLFMTEGSSSTGTKVDTHMSRPRYVV